MMQGADAILVVDLGSRQHRVEPLPAEAGRRYLGGRGLGAYLLARYLPPRDRSPEPRQPRHL